MRRYSRLRMRELLVWPRYRDVAMCLGVLLVLTSTMRSGAFGGDPQFLSEEKAAARAKDVWENGAVNLALDILDQAIHDNPDALTLRKLCGDVLAPSRCLQEMDTSERGRRSHIVLTPEGTGAQRQEWASIGAHECLPIDPSDSFPTTQQEIYLVFGLVSASYEAVPLTAQCFWETSEVAGQQRALAQDRVVISTNDRSGYFLLSRPEAGWTPGLYRCGLFEGERTSAYAHVDEVRFRIMEPGQAS